MWYKHFNFTTKTKDGIEDLFFGEVKEEGDNELVANTFCKIESNENGKYQQMADIMGYSLKTCIWFLNLHIQI
jgi:hypothetical protein